MTLVVTVAVIAAVFFTYLRIYRYNWNRELSVDTEFDRKTSLEGDTAYIRECVTNAKRLSIPVLNVNLKFTRNNRIINSSEEYGLNKRFNREVFTMRPYRKVTRKIPFNCSKRGFYRISYIDLTSTDIFFGSHYRDEIESRAGMYVYPAFVNLAKIDAAFKRVMGEVVVKNSAFEDPFEYRGIREYEIYDTMKSINWTASAKTGELKVNTHNYTSNREVMILLNLEENTNERYDMLKEECIRIASALSEMLILNGVSTGIMTNGMDCINGETVLINSGQGRDHIITIKQALARVMIPDIISNYEIDIEELGINEANTVYVVITSVMTEELTKVLDTIENKTVVHTMFTGAAEEVYKDSICWEVAYE